MNKHSKKTDAINPAGPSHEQEEINTTSPRRALQEEAQKEGVQVQQHSAKGRQRGKYRQYEDSQIIIDKIRSYRTERYPDYEIIKVLDNMPRRTFYNYVEKLQEQDRQFMEQCRKQNLEHVSEEMMIHRETLCQKYREFQAIIDNKNTSTKDKMQAIDKQLAISEKLAKFTRDERPSNIESAKHDGYATF